MNCKFKFHLQATLHRGAAGPVGLCRSGRACRRSRWSSAEFGGRCRAGGSVEVGRPAGVPGGALPNLVGAAGPVAPPDWAGLPAVPMRRCRTWWALPGRWLRRLGSFFRIFRSTVRARKPNSLALRAGVREPSRPAGSFFRIFRSAVRARKPSSLTLRADGRKRAPAGGPLFSDLQVCGSRSKTEFIGFAGRRARTGPAPGLLFPDFQVHGSRSKTEFIDFAGRRARTAPAGELRSDEKRCTEGPAGLRASLPTIIFPKGKN